MSTEWVDMLGKVMMRWMSERSTVDGWDEGHDGVDETSRRGSCDFGVLSLSLSQN